MCITKRLEKVKQVCEKKNIYVYICVCTCKYLCIYLHARLHTKTEKQLWKLLTFVLRHKETGDPHKEIDQKIKRKKKLHTLSRTKIGCFYFSIQFFFGHLYV